MPRGTRRHRTRLWGTPVVENGLVYFGIANPYRSINDAFKHPNKLLYNDSTVALDANKAPHPT